MATSTPWGIAQHVEFISPGIAFYTTASHGGYHLNKARNAQVKAEYRHSGGWYEEDCGWAAVARSFPELFPEIRQDRLNNVLIMWLRWLEKTDR
jgi:hypothetical protein